MKRAIFTVVTLILFQSSGLSQSFEELVRSSLEKSRNGEFGYLTKSDFEDLNGLEEALQVLRNNVEDSIPAVRRNCFWTAKRLRSFVEDKNLRIQLSDIVAFGLNDPESGIVGSTISYLELFTRDEISSDTRDQLHLLIQQSTFHYDRVVRLTGYFNDGQTLSVLQSLNRSDSLSIKTKWNIRLAMVRIGDLKYEDYIVNKIRKLSVNDNVVYEILPDLIYSRSAKGMQYLDELVMSDELNCRPADMEVQGQITCAYRVMELIGPVLQGFPFVVEDDQVETEDYEQALTIVRDWVSGLNGQYPIDNSIY